MNSFLAAIWYILPAYFANASPVVFGGGKPMDLGKRWVDGRRMFGDHKTVRGFLAGIVIGSLAGWLQGRPLVGIAQSLGAMMGDLAGSFIKRRIGLSPGGWAPVLDEEAFLLFALAPSTFVEPVSINVFAVLLVVTPLIHLVTNLLKRVALRGES